MYKTIWLINYDKYSVEFTQYHFGREPKFPSWYMEEGHVYTIELLWNHKCIPTLNLLLKCIFKSYSFRDTKK